MAVQRNADLIEFPASGNQPLVRLCNFKTGKSDLNPAHMAWIKQTLVPLARSPGVVIRLEGFASKLGSAAVNLRLSESRAAAVQKYLESQLGQSLADVEAGAYGESLSGGGENDNNPVYRAVDVWVYQPAPTPPPPRKPPDVSQLGTKLYFGVGAKFGGMIILGTQTLEGYLFSADDYNDQAYLESRIITAGLGLGGGANAVFVLGFGAREKKQFVGVKYDGWDFSASLGGRWGDAVKAAKRLPALARIAKALKESKKGGKALRLATKLTPGEWEKIGELVKTSREALGADPNATTPQLVVFDIPLVGAALEVSLYKWWGTVTAFH